MDDPKTLNSTPYHQNAYVWLLMKGDYYLPGVFTSVFSVKRTNPNADLVVMVTSDVSEHARNTLKKVATYLHEIPYITFESKKMKTERQRQIYESWINSSYSKWNALTLPYKKVILLDSDTIHTENTDELFELNAPAMVFASPFVKPIGKLESRYKGPIGRDGYPIHGTSISPTVISDILNIGGILPTSTPALVEPNIDDFNEYLKTISSMQPFGFPNCHSGFDEQSIFYFYSVIKGLPITAIHQRYNYYPWKDGFLYRGDIPRVIHFFSDSKPWSLVYNKYPDVITWYKMASIAIEGVSITPADINLKDDDIEKAKTALDTFIKKFMRVSDVTEIVGKLKRN
jgi:lipopolysaccharide biosynthesis glycosyltransferase